jgi:DNA-binding transcriptional LysR family regulator
VNIRNIDLNLLVLFEVLLTERNVSRAAVRLGLSQPAMSNALGRLRQTLGDPILVRAGRQLVPTSRAVELMAPIGEALRTLGEALAPRPPFHPSHSEITYRIETTDYVEMILFSQLIGHLEKAAPKVRLHTRFLKERIPLQGLVEGQLDLAIGYFPEPPPSLYQLPLFTDDFVCVLRKDHPLAGRPMTLENFVSQKQVIVAPWKGMTEIADSLLKKKGLKREIYVSTPHFLIAPHLVAETNYLVTLPRRMASAVSRWLPLEVFEHPLQLPTFTFSQLWHQRTHHEPAHHWLRQTLLQLAKETPAIVVPPRSPGKARRA